MNSAAKLAGAAVQPEDQAIDPGLREAFLGGMSHAACTVNVVTTDGPAGRAGVTVSAMSSVSADTPRPTLLVCVHHLSRTADAILANGVLCVNVLRDDQSFISDVFAGRHVVPGDDKFACASWTTQVTGAPRVVDPLVAFDCRLTSHDRVGTHYVFFAEVEDIHVAGRGSPLIYANRAYGTSAPLLPSLDVQHGDAKRGSRSLSIACFHTFGPYILPELIGRLAQLDPGVDLRLVEGDQQRVRQSLLDGESELALMYALDGSEGLQMRLLTRLQPYVLLAEGHALAAHASLTPAQLASQPMVLLSAPPSREYFLDIMRSAGVEPRIACESASFEMVRGMVGHGLGYALLATKPASAMTYDGRALVSRPLCADAEPSPVVLATRPGAVLSASAGRFVALCEAFFGLEPAAELPSPPESPQRRSSP